ncbi:MAG: hypothetical protein IPM79_34795 [Polyangiaceae bacterium]|nr:hypothetical protein [Polyangiaceae bacterium]
MALSTAACVDEAVLPAPAEVDVEGGFDVRVVEGNRLVVAAADGRVLLDGLAPAPIAGDAPPLVGFATRQVTTTYEMQFGAFKPTLTPHGPWAVADSLDVSELKVSPRASGRALVVLSFSTAEEGHLVVDLSLPDGEVPEPSSPERRTKLSWGFACDTEDRFAGLGAQAFDADHRGQTVPTFVTEGGIGRSTTDDYAGLWMLQGQRHSSHAPLPQVLSRRGYVLTVETDRRSTLALCSESETAARVEVDIPARIHVFDGPSPAAALERASATFGRPRMPPRVAFAPWLDAVFGSDNVRRIAQKARDERIPASVIWTEDWRGGEWSGETYALEEEWEVDRTLYPDIEEVADDLHALGFDFHVYFNPFIYEGTQAWEETAHNGWLVETRAGEPYLFTGAKFTNTGLLDLTHPEAREWAVGKMRDAMALGADGWMHDFAEWLPTDGVVAAGPSYEQHNVWPVLWQEIAREAIDGADDGGERLFFARSGWFGTPELVDVFWAGDQQTTFAIDDGLPTIIPQGIGLGVAGISTYGHDIAGYQSAAGPGSTKELFFRWTELGAWSPVMRTHHGAQPDKEWSWEKDPETIDHFRRYAELHVALVPTLAGLAAHASATGVPIWRHLALRFPQDATVWPITDQVMLGEGLMIAPVVSEGATSRDVYLPAGRWFPFDGGASVEGPATITVDAPVTEIPVFAAAGTIVPMYPPGVATLVRESEAIPGPSAVGDDRHVLVFLGADGAFEEADGLSYVLTSDVFDPEGALSITFSEDGAQAEPLASCEPDGSVTPCFDVSGDAVLVFVEGPGVVAVNDAAGHEATFTTSGGWGRTVVRLRR